MLQSCVIYHCKDNFVGIHVLLLSLISHMLLATHFARSVHILVFS